jgi:hypothetical protein
MDFNYRVRRLDDIVISITPEPVSQHIEDIEWRLEEMLSCDESTTGDGGDFWIAGVQYEYSIDGRTTDVDAFEFMGFGDLANVDAESEAEAAHRAKMIETTEYDGPQTFVDGNGKKYVGGFLGVVPAMSPAV